MISGWSSKALGGVERRRGRGLNARDPGRRETTGKVLKERRSPRRRGRMGTNRYATPSREEASVDARGPHRREHVARLLLPKVQLQRPRLLMHDLVVRPRLTRGQPTVDVAKLQNHRTRQRELPRPPPRVRQLGQVRPRTEHGGEVRVDAHPRVRDGHRHRALDGAVRGAGHDALHDDLRVVPYEATS
eukprot:31456-Pelagococcus_subviridis.AAC.1